MAASVGMAIPHSDGGDFCRMVVCYVSRLSSETHARCLDLMMIAMTTRHLPQVCR